MSASTDHAAASTLMSLRQIGELTLLGAIWGASFLFMRVAAPEFGALPTSFIRLATGAAVLWPLARNPLRTLGGAQALRGHLGALLMVGTLNSALPFTLFAYATQVLPASYTSILNASAPLWGAVIGWLAFAERLDAMRWAGLGIGFTGIVLLTGSNFSAATLTSLTTGTVAGIAAGASYGLAAHLAKRWLAALPPQLVAAGTQIAAACVLAPLAAWRWPHATPGTTAWLSVMCLGLLCTGIAYLVYFRLILAVGALRATSVAYLIPVFGVLWGSVVLGETVTESMLLGGLVVLVGTALTTGTLDRKEPRRGAKR